MQTRPRDIETVLASANRRLGDLMRKEPPALATGGARTLDDSLWIWGIIGGKEVGKSTLINALAGHDVAASTQRVGEGTFRPEAYLTADDRGALRERFATLGSASVGYHTGASAGMRNLVLVDLPDFDSLFTEHCAQVRRITAVLDGIIWITTPKKIGDLRAITEVRQVLKARTNFVYVVNKIDWLIGQSDQPPRRELDRCRDALRDQIEQCDPADGADRCFLISAKYRSDEAMLDSIAKSRGVDGSGYIAESNGALTEAVRQVLGEFDVLKETLTTTPTAEAAEADKNANVTYQSRRQARQLLQHFQPRAVLSRLDEAVTTDALDEAVTRAFPSAYCNQLLHRQSADNALFVDWSTALFKNRIAHWPLLGLIAWPVTLLGPLFAGVARLIPRSTARTVGDPFRADGLSLDERAQAAHSAIRLRLSTGCKSLDIDLPDPAALAEQFRADTESLATELRTAIIQPWLHKKPGLIGRLWRGILPPAVLLWFPIGQPILAAALQGLQVQTIFNLDLALLLVQAFSAANVLAGLGVSILILSGLVAAIYSGAARDTFAALDRLRDGSDATIAAPLQHSLMRSLRDPIDAVRSQLSELTTMLERISAADG